MSPRQRFALYHARAISRVSGRRVAQDIDSASPAGYTRTGDLFEQIELEAENRRSLDDFLKAYMADDTPSAPSAPPPPLDPIEVALRRICESRGLPPSAIVPERPWY